MNKSFDQLIEWMQTGNEIGFTFEEKRYSITYGRNDNQQDFNCLASFRMTSVDTDAEKAAAVRAALHQLLDQGQWLMGGHGAPMVYHG